MAITVGFGADSKISGILLTNYQESKDFGADYPATYVGQDSALGGVDTVAGVTYSSKAFKDAITDAFNTLINSGLLAAGEKSEEQLIGEVKPKLPTLPSPRRTKQRTAAAISPLFPAQTELLSAA